MVSINECRARRGVLLLVVLSVLTLFLMLGAAYVAVASRARKAARAFANNVVAGAAGGMAHERLLDEAFMAVARGTTGSKQDGGLVDYIGNGVKGGNDLLGDKYGPQTAKGRINVAAKVAGSPAVLQLTGTVTSGSVAQAVSDYPGRVVTLALPSLSVSTRIIGATGSPNQPTLFIAGGPTITGETLSDTRINAAIAKVTSANATTLIINGREFDGSGENEPYDGYDVENPLLTRSGTTLATTGTAVINSDTAPLNIDNDGDGVPDSRFLDIGLQPVLGANGQLVYPRAAILVLDLDGRLNVNAHGSPTDAQTAGSYPTLYPAPTLSSTTVPLYQLPRGFASGPADVSLSRSLIFSDTSAAVLTEAEIVHNATSSLAGTNPSGTDRLSDREVPRIGAVEGRYGDGGTTGTSALLAGTVGAGQPNFNDLVSRAADRWRASLDATFQSHAFHSRPGRFGSPWDVKSRMRIWADEFGQPVYFKPTWPTGTNDEVTDDPYEVNLTRLGSRAAYATTPFGSAPADSLFSPAELEGLLRYHDPDSLKLPRRLVAISGSNASANRLRLTTESWDTPAVAGSAWRTAISGTAAFAQLLASTNAPLPNRPYDSFSPETIMGHKLDINRPFHDTQYDEPNDATGTARRQVFARHLYCLMVAIVQANGVVVDADLARQIAQYAVNVVDYRDGDSAMTRFEYDPKFGSPGTNNWAPGPDDYVWGCERPELLMTETLAWHDRRTDDLSVGNKVVDPSGADDDFDQSRRPWGAFFVELYSPWRSRTAALAASGTATALRSGSATRADPIPGSLRQSGTFGFDIGDAASVQDSTITLNKTVGGCPVWRLASVRGNVQGGTGIDNSTNNIVDPSAPGSTAIVDRVFYFGNLTGSGTALRNPSNPKDGTPGAVFWTSGSAAVEPSQSNYVVVGTAGLGFTFTRSAATPTAPGQLDLANTVHLQFDQPSLTANDRLPATLSEPVNTAPATTSSRDPYELLATHLDGGNQNKFTPDNSATPQFYEPTRKLQKPVDQPLDMATGVAGISLPVLTGTTGGLPAGRPLLMFNGTHENFSILHLQRLADPDKPWNSTSNPYITVDSMPVDLTVVNTNTAGANHDEPGLTGASPLSWLTTQKQYRFKAVQRGGQSPSGTPERDIWSRRVNETATNLASGTTVISGSSPYLTTGLATRTSGSTAINLTPPIPALIPATTPLLTGTTDHTLREYASQTERDSRPARFEKGANKPPLFPWLAWPNQPFGSVVDLALVPVTSPFDLTGRHSTNAPGSPSQKWFHLPRFFEATAPEAPWDALAGRAGSGNASLFDFVHVPSPYAAIYTTVEPTTTGSAALAAIGLDVFPINQISNFREPGRVNVNTVTDRRVWRALFGAVDVKGVNGDTDNPDDPQFFPAGEVDARDRLPGWTATLFSQPSAPAQRIADFFRAIPRRGTTAPRNPPASGGFLDEFANEDTNSNGTLDAGEDSNDNGILDAGEDSNGNGILDEGEDSNKNSVLDFNRHRDTDLHAFFRYQTMRQLSNVTTTRSHVYGVWITIAYMDGPSPSAEEVQPIARNRAFFIFDRSIPVAYEQGKDHNVRDAILLRRVIQ